MLRRKLLTRLGLLVVAFVAGAVVSLWLLQDVLRDLESANRDAAVLIDGVQNVGAAIGEAEAALSSIRLGRTPDDDALAAVGVRLRSSHASLGEHPLMTEAGAPATEVYARVGELLAVAWPEPGPLLALPDPLRADAARAALEGFMDLRRETTELSRLARRHVAARQAAVHARLKALAIGLSVAALIMVNAAVLVLARTVQMILRPVDALIEGSRELASERFEHRVRVEEGDEFAELAHAYNRLAEQLAANEQRKVDTLRQVAVTLNHDLNNLMSTIAMQLALADRRAGGDPRLAEHLREIHTQLDRMADTVRSLHHVRRIVLTDYLPGQKMLDLPRSISEDGALGSPGPAPTGLPEAPAAGAAP